MPTYFYQCEKCEAIKEDTASMLTFKDHHPNCDECNSVCNYIFIATVPQTILKDGPTGSWPSKGERYKKYRAKRYEDLGRKQRDRYGKPRELVPNYDGKETGTWREAQYQAGKERGSESAATYTDRVADEKAKGIK